MNQLFWLTIKAGFGLLPVNTDFKVLNVLFHLFKKGICRCLWNKNIIRSPLRYQRKGKQVIQGSNTIFTISPKKTGMTHQCTYSQFTLTASHKDSFGQVSNGQGHRLGQRHWPALFVDASKPSQRQFVTSYTHRSQFSIYGKYILRTQTWGLLDILHSPVWSGHYHVHGQQREQ